MIVFAVAVAVGALAAVIQASFFEWAFHRYLLHRPWLPKECFTSHTLIHHQLCKFDDAFRVTEEEQHEALTFKWWGGPLLIVINLGPWWLAAWAMAAAGIRLPYLATLISGVAAFSLYYAGYEGFHYLMHKPTIGFIERSRWFRFLERHHRIHHVHMDRNLNVLLPLADAVLGTLVLEAPAPRPTPAAARTLARRHSHWGEKLRQGEPPAKPIPTEIAPGALPKAE